ncbi:MAG: alpha-hydroxy acid oxidase [Gemmatimonadaceae bacterium]
MLRTAATGVAAAALATPATTASAQFSPRITREALPPKADQPLASLGDFERAAHAVMTPMAYDYISGGAGDEVTLGWNQSAYSDIKLRSRILVDVSHIDTSVTIFGQKLAHPIVLSPTAYHKLVHPEGEVATARGAGAANAALVVSSFATTSIEDIARAATGPLWLQLYAQPDRGFTKAWVERAEAAGCKAICLTVDTPVLGARNRETRIGFKLPDGVTRVNLEALGKTEAQASHRPTEGQIYSSVLDPRLTWKEVSWLRGFAKVPVLLKGVLDPDDAKHAVDAGVSGLIVSNHGARNLDTVPATITALPRVAEAVAGRVPIMMDGGIRRGTDVLKALALGATVVGIGRPYLYGLAVDGSNGVKHVVDILRTELEMAMALTGRTSIKAIDRRTLWS